jgi:multidrug efflux pump subunit AcrB
MFGKLIERPIAVTMTIISVIVLGAVAVGLLPVSLMPDVAIPRITIQVNAPGYSAREVESVLLSPLEEKLKQLPSLTSLRSEASNNSGTILLEFRHGSDINFLYVEANENIDRALSAMPSDIERPKVIKASATDIPAFFLNITSAGNSSEHFTELSRFVADVIAKRVEQIPEVALVDMSGLSLPEILIIPDSRKLSSTGISESQLRMAIESSNLRLGNLSIKDGHYRWDIRFMTEIRSKEDIEKINLNINGRVYRFADLASITEKPSDDKGIIRLDGKRSVMLAVIKQSDAKMSSLKNALGKLMADFEKEYPGTEFSVNRDQTQLLEYSISNLRSNIIIGAFLAILIIFLFLQDLRSPLLISISIPLSLIVSLLFFYLAGISLNVISLSGLMLGIGMMVDNSIIVIDNITQIRQRGEGLREAVIKGVSEVVAPMLSSVLTTCSVFIPLVFLSGIAGALFYDQAMGVTIGLFASLGVAVLVIPVYYYLFYSRRGEAKKIKLFPGSWHFDYDALYEKGLVWVFRHQKITWTMFILAIPATIFLYTLLDKSKLPPVTRDDTILQTDWNTPVTIEESDHRNEYLASVVKDLISGHISIVGTQQFLLPHTPELSQSGALLYLKAKNPSDLLEIEKRVSEAIRNREQEATFRFTPSDNIFNLIFDEQEYNLTAKIRSRDGKAPDPDKLNNFLSKISSSLPDIYIGPVRWQEQILYQIDPELMTLYKLNYSGIYNILKSTTRENRLLSINNGNYSVPVIFGLGEGDTADILSARIVNQDGAEIPLSAVIKETRIRDLKTITSGFEGNYYPLNMNIPDKEVPGVMKTIEEISGPDESFDVIFGGSYFSNRQMIRELFIILIVAFLLLYFILSAQFESLIQPFIILSEIIVDIFGAFLLLWLFGSGLNLMSMIGLVVMCGIIINDSILKVDTINRLRREGYPLLRAIFTGGNRRLKPIIMTSLTTILAIAPFLVRGNLGSDLQYPLSLALIGGMVVGTIVSIFFIPVFYYTIYKNKQK